LTAINISKAHDSQFVKIGGAVISMHSCISEN